jgi:hypothetical protein
MTLLLHFFVLILLSISVLLQGNGFTEVDESVATLRCENLNGLNKLEVGMQRSRSPPSRIL